MENESVVIRKCETKNDEYDCHSVMVRVENIDLHYQRTAENGGKVLNEPTTHLFGERQYSVKDFMGHIWTFSETVEDTLPEQWGGQTVIDINYVV